MLPKLSESTTIESWANWVILKCLTVPKLVLGAREEALTNSIKIGIRDSVASSVKINPFLFILSTPLM